MSTAALGSLSDDILVPEHLAIIMDGNGRWAKNQGAERIFGHKNAITAVRDAVEGSAEIGVKFLTLYAFSTENWGRPQQEVNALMELLVHTISAELETLQKNNIRLATIGNTEGLPEQCKKELQAAIKATESNARMTLVLALNYSGRWDLTQATQQIAKKVLQGEIEAQQVNEEFITKHLSTAFMPNPCLLIRTSGEMRISNFLLWELAYTELYITPVLWPDFDKAELNKAIQEFSKRERRFGKVLHNEASEKSVS